MGSVLTFPDLKDGMVEAPDLGFVSLIMESLGPTLGVPDLRNGSEE